MMEFDKYQEPEMYVDEDAAKVIRKNIPKKLKKKFSFDDILTIVSLMSEYFEENGFLSEENSISVYTGPELDEEDFKYFIINRAAKQDIYMTYNELEIILDAESIYLEQIGAFSDPRELLN
jgi:hypothetical protein